MRLTRESEYALLGLAHLAKASGEGGWVSVAEVAGARGLPSAFLARIFRKLVRHGLLVSERGRGSGHALARAPEAIAIREVLEAVEGPDLLTRCLLWDEHCVDDDPCPLHHRLKELHPALEEILTRTTLADYVADAPHAALHLSFERKE